MTKHTFAIMGATGHIGYVLTTELLKRGHKVKALGRNKHKLQTLKEKGAEIISTAFDDASALAEAFKGCNAVFSLIPPSYEAENYETYQTKVSEAIQQALIKANISNVVNLSSIGAQLSQGTGPIKGLHHHEKRLNSIPHLNVLHFRPSYFMENLLWSIPLIKNSGLNGSAVRADLPIPMVATRDIGLKIAEILDLLKFTGQTVFEYVGPRTLSLKEATTIIGKAIGKQDLKYVQFSHAEAEKGLSSIGIKHNLVKLYLEMYESFNQGKIVPTQQLTPDHHGKTTFEEFSKTFLQAYQSASSKEQLAAARH